MHVPVLHVFFIMFFFFFFFLIVHCVFEQLVDEHWTWFGVFPFVIKSLIHESNLYFCSIDEFLSFLSFTNKRGIIKWFVSVFYYSDFNQTWNIYISHTLLLIIKYLRFNEFNSYLFPNPAITFKTKIFSHSIYAVSNEIIYKQQQ